MTDAYKPIEEQAHNYAEAQNYTKGTMRSAARKGFIEGFKRGAREGWMRCGVVHVDIDFEKSDQIAEIDRRWPLTVA